MYPDVDDRHVAVLAEGENWAAVYSAAGTAAHPHPHGTGEGRTLVSRVRATFGKPVHLVHRLDSQASGVCLVAFDAESCTQMHAALRSSAATKSYYALCWNNGTDLVGRGPFMLDRPLRDKQKLNPQLRKRYKNASTEVEMLWGGDRPPCCLVRAQPLTGRYHQIRRHLQNISFPIVGDKNWRRIVQADWEACGLEFPQRVLLHLHHVALPCTERTPAIDVVCPLPPDFAAAVRQAGPGWAAEAEATLPALFRPPPPNLRPAAAVAALL